MASPSYWDPTVAGAGTGTLADPYKAQADASTSAGTGGEVRALGRAITLTSSTGVFLNNNASVTGATIAGIAGGDYIRPSTGGFALANMPWYRVASVSGTTITLNTAFQGTAGTYSIQIATSSTRMTNGAAQSLTATGQTLTYGWYSNGGTATQSADPTADGAYITMTTGDYEYTLGQADTLVQADGRFVAIRESAASGHYPVNITANCRITGTIEGAGATSSSAGAQVNIGNGATSVRIDSVRSSYGAMGVVNSYALLAIRRVDFHGLTYDVIYTLSTASATARMMIGCAYLLGCTRCVTAQSDIVIGLLYVRNPNGTTYPPRAITSGTISIGILDQASSGYSPTGPRMIGGPVNAGAAGAADTEWCVADQDGVWNKTIGRGGNLGLRCVPASKNRETIFTIGRPVTSGHTITLSFYAVYTGTISDPPIVTLRPVEPNGLDVVDYVCGVASGTTAIPRVTSTNVPGGSPDGWLQATQQTVTFTGTTTQPGSIQIAFMVRANAAVDSVLYIDDISWVLT